MQSPLAPLRVEREKSTAKIEDITASRSLLVVAMVKLGSERQKCKSSCGTGAQHVILLEYCCALTLLVDA